MTLPLDKWLVTAHLHDYVRSRADVIFPPAKEASPGEACVERAMHLVRVHFQSQYHDKIAAVMRALYGVPPHAYSGISFATVTGRSSPYRDPLLVGTVLLLGPLTRTAVSPIGEVEAVRQGVDFAQLRAATLDEALRWCDGFVASLKADRVSVAMYQNTMRMLPLVGPYVHKA